MARKARLWGAAKGSGIEQWAGVGRVPEQYTMALLERLLAMEEAGTVDHFHFMRVGFLGTGGAVFWIGRTPKANRSVCGARTRKGTPCAARVVGDTERCRMHGGLSTGPKTAEGRVRIAESNRRRARERRVGQDA